jgi:hypothetical protein
VQVTDVRTAKAFDPLLTLQFIISLAAGRQPAAYTSKVCGLTRTTDVATSREGGAPQARAPHFRPEAMTIEQTLMSTPMRTHP